MINDKIIIPPIKIQGIKSKLIPTIKRCVKLESDTCWIELFMGSGSVGFNIAFNRKAIFADINPYLINFYNAIKYHKISSIEVRDYLEEMSIQLQNGNDNFYYHIRDRFNEFHSNLDFLFLNRSCFNGMIRFNKNGKFNVPYCHKPKRFSKAYITKIVNQIKEIENRIEKSDWEFVCQSFEKTISEAPNNSFIYCDPPYIGRHVDYYDSWEEKNEILLHGILKKKGTNFMVSSWSHNFYRNNYYLNTIWNDCIINKKDHYYFIGGKEKNRNPIVEAIITNYKIDQDKIDNEKF